MKKKRENNYDLLRSFAAVAVIMIHVSATYTNALSSVDGFRQYDTGHVLCICIYNVISRFAVPCFVMLSGAFILADEKNSRYSLFYKKTFRNVGIPTIIFSILYFVYSMLRQTTEVMLAGNKLTSLLDPVKAWVRGEPFYHMWYLYMMIGVYLLAPIVIKVRKDIGEKRFEQAAWIFLILATLSVWTSTYKLKWNIGSSFCYLGYFMIGYVLRKKSVKSNLKAGIYIALVVCVDIGITLLRYRQALNGIPDVKLEYALVEPCCPLVVVASVLIFKAFSCMTVKRSLGIISGSTFYIYLFHAGIWDISSRILSGLFGADADARVTIPLSVIGVFIVSLCLSKIYQYIWERFNLSDVFCRLFRISYGREN